ncbi:MAG: hypothetical protein HOJ35_07825 [Bdellovibrionales bacterium]|jgi:hypothetical protein|nr:hypothetical protein [Bdellovibrionales bacterium]
MKLNNYLVSALSSWIANLGVVPLFLFAVFLFLPRLAFLFFLLLSSFCPSDAIYILLNNSFFKSLKHDFVPTQTHSVKVIFLFGILVSPSSYSKVSPENIVISIGEHSEINVNNIKNYSIGNPDILHHTFNSKENRLLIKGKKMGFSEIAIWDSKNKKVIYHLYILSKREQLNLKHVAQSLSSFGFKIKTFGKYIEVRGEIEDIYKYNFLNIIKSKNPTYLLVHSKLTKKLRNHLIGEVYYSFLQENLENFSCSSNFSIISCSYSATSAPSKNIIKYLQNKYFINFLEVNDINDNKNYLVKIKFYSIENQKESSLKLGINELNEKIPQALTNNYYQQLDIQLSQEKLKYSSLSSPEIIIKLNEEAKIKIGTKISSSQNIIRDGKETMITHHDFLGISTIIRIKKSGNKFTLYSKNTLSNQGDQNDINNNSSTSKIFITLNKAFTFFETNLKLSKQTIYSMPFFSSIPIIGHIFKKTNKTNTNKKIIGIFYFQESFI